LVPAFASDVTIQRNHLWWLHDGHRAVRQGDFKLVSAKNKPWELYNLKTDRAESKNLVNQKPKLKEKLETLWNDQVEEFKRLY
jgi:arylsulfatase